MTILKRESQGAEERRSTRYTYIERTLSTRNPMYRFLGPRTVRQIILDPTCPRAIRQRSKQK